MTGPERNDSNEGGHPVTHAGLFNSSRVAEGYAACRPRFHGQVLDTMARRVSLAPCQRALDVGCGTGLSTEPLVQFAHLRVGIDRSHSMLRAAPAVQSTGFAAATGEFLPFGSAVFDLITVSGAINWIQRSAFLTEARRVLRRGGWLWIYDGAEQGQMVDTPAYADWYSQYQSRLPRPARDERPVTTQDAEAHDFELCVDDAYQLQLPFGLTRWIGFLMTQSAVTQAVADQRESLNGIQDWMASSLAPHFAGEERLMLFGGPIWCLQAGGGD